MKFIYFFKKSQNDVVLAQLTAGHNWNLTEYQIDSNWWSVWIKREGGRV